MALDLSWLSYYMSIFGFILVFVVMYAILIKTKILGENSFINAFVSFIFAIIFISFSPGVDYIGTVVPWFAILLICLFLVMVIVGLSQKKMEDFMKPWIAWVFIILLIVIFLASAFVVFNPFFEAHPFVKDFVVGERFLGAALLLVIAAITSWILTKKAK